MNLLMYGQTRLAKAFVFSTMSEAPRFGGDGILERHYYNELNPEAERIAGCEASEALEELFQSAYNVDSVMSSMSLDGELSSREMRAAYAAFDGQRQGEMWADVRTGNTTYYDPQPNATDRKVVVRHHGYRNDDFKIEEYFVSVERKLPLTDTPFYVLYEIEFFKGGSVNTNVRNNRIAIDNKVSGNMLEQRSMTQYDVDELKKEITEIKKYFEVGIAEKSRDYLFNDAE